MSSAEFVYARAYSPLSRCSHIPHCISSMNKNVNCSSGKQEFPNFLKSIFILFWIFLDFFSYVSSEPDCPSLESADRLSQTQLIKRLTHSCRYDRLERPTSIIHTNLKWFFKNIKFQILFSAAFSRAGEREPIAVWARAYIYFMQNLEAHDLVCSKFQQIRNRTKWFHLRSLTVWLI